MNSKDIITLGLGLQAPWEITGQLLDTDKNPHELRLTIQAQRSPVQHLGRVILEEYETGHYLRRFTLAESIDQERIEAALVNGVLKVRLPKLGPSQPKKITVKIG